MLGVSCLLVACPFLIVRFPPITDLPQHVAQIRLLLETVGHLDSPYTVQWFTPYGLVYALMGAAWAVVGPLDAGRIAMLAIGLLSVGATHHLAAVRGRSPAAATLASALFFSHIVYWGFYNFMFTWPIFALWLILTTGARARRVGWMDLGLLLGCAVLLYASHILWLAVAVLWLVVSGLVFRVPLGSLALRLSSVMPVLVAVLLWFPRLGERGFRSATVWGPSPLARLAPRWLLDAAFGSLAGLVEPIIFGGIVIWLVLGLWGAWSRRAEARGTIDRELLLAAGLLLALALVLPIKHTNTIRFAERWLPFALTLGILALPAPPIRSVLQLTVALGLLATMTLATAAVWRTFERVGLAGLPAALEALPERPRVIGLDYVGSTPLLKTRPFIQVFAYSQVIHGGRLNFSFAQFAPSLVVDAHPQRRPWTPGLEWFPEWVRPEDFSYFDYALINGRSPPERRRAVSRRAGHDQRHVAPLRDSWREAAGMSD